MSPKNGITVGIVALLLTLASGCADRSNEQLVTDDRATEPNAPAQDISPDSIAELLLVDVVSLDATIVVDARYHGSNNFMGERLPGYGANRVLMRREAAEALARAQADLASRGLGLLLWDGYRPVRATQAMVDWTERVGREDLLEDGYIASRSRHNLGLAIDLTLIRLSDGESLDMGTPFDTFDESAHTLNATGAVRENRQLLVDALTVHGFTNYEKEWWHFSYDVPDPRRFDLPIR